MQRPLPGAPRASWGAQKKPPSSTGLWIQHCLWLEPGQELPGKRQEQGEGVRAQPGSLGAAGAGRRERNMQGQGHAWAQLNSRPSHVGESVALAERLVLLGVERLPFQVGLADLGRRAQEVRSGELSQPLGPPRHGPGLSTGVTQMPGSRGLRAGSRTTSTEPSGENLGRKDPTLLVYPTQGTTARESPGPTSSRGRETHGSPHRRSKCRAS